MNDQDLSKEEILKKYQELKQKYNSLKSLYKKDIIDLKQIKQELVRVNKELAFQINEKEKRVDELVIVNQVLESQNIEREKRADELIIANKELTFQNEEKEKRALELIKAREQAKESDHLKSSFLANISHEIRTPMNGILGFIQILKESNLTGEEQQEYISFVEKSGARMMNILNDIIAISKIETKQMEISISKTDINEQIENIYTHFKPEAENKRIQISIKKSLLANEAFIKTDKDKIYSIISNLVNNAIKFTSSGSVEFGYEKKGNYLNFFVKDTGIGIPGENKELIFEKFRQGSDSISRNFEGAGLGLYISKAFVEMIGGKIWFESEPEKGSIFYFSIPYNAESQEDNFIDNLTLDKGREDHIKNLKILIAEDDEVTQKFLELIVKRFCKKILRAGTGVDTIKTCRNNPDIDLVLMDVRMPEIDGFEATRQIRQFNNNVIIFAQTAFEFYGIREKALESGCNEYLSKPVLKNELIRLINRFFNN
jgi:signal transduction histidine kinase/CheY-like chemotaxis protein